MVNDFGVLRTDTNYGRLIAAPTERMVKVWQHWIAALTDVCGVSRRRTSMEDTIRNAARRARRNGG